MIRFVCECGKELQAREANAGVSETTFKNAIMRNDGALLGPDW